jgi:hypothetical protein
MPKRNLFSSNVLACALALAAVIELPSRSAALERPPAPDTAWEQQSGPWSYGLYVIGDSISFAVPYGPTGDSLNIHTWERAGFGWSTFAHRNEHWGASGLTSFEDAAGSPASVVFVELGTNDTGCMRAAPMCWEYPDTPEKQEAERWKMVGEISAGAQQLVDAGKCVIWAGTREIERADSSYDEAKAFNLALRKLEGALPGKFFYIDYSAYSFDNEALRYSLDDAPDADHIHPKTDEGRQAVANLAFWYARLLCGL